MSCPSDAQALALCAFYRKAHSRSALSPLTVAGAGKVCSQRGVCDDGKEGLGYCNCVSPHVFQGEDCSNGDCGPGTQQIMNLSTGLFQCATCPAGFFKVCMSSEHASKRSHKRLGNQGGAVLRCFALLLLQDDTGPHQCVRCSAGYICTASAQLPCSSGSFCEAGPSHTKHGTRLACS